MKRFYRDVSVGPLNGAADGFGIFLDGRAVKTPDKAPLALPSQSLAEILAEEWRTVPEEFDVGALQLTKCANTAIDRVAVKQPEVAEALLAYANDLICYRADHPSELVARQSAHWDPLIVWVEQRFGARLCTGVGVVPFDQPAEALAILRDHLLAQNIFVLTALHGAAALTGSLVLALALAEGKLDVPAAFALSRLDEDYQAERWGRDEEAEARAAGLLVDLTAYGRFLKAAMAS
ncbi:MAG: ATP12 family protein [Rhizomicrobium sp.]